MGQPDNDGSFLEQALRRHQIRDPAAGTAESGTVADTVADTDPDTDADTEAGDGPRGSSPQPAPDDTRTQQPAPDDTRTQQPARPDGAAAPSSPPVGSPASPSVGSAASASVSDRQGAGLSVSALALIDEAMRKSWLIWVRTGSSPLGRALWHVWVDARAYVVTGGDEQPDPGFGTEPVVVVVRSKETASRLLAFTADVSTAAVDDEDWPLATAELAKARLNLRRPEEAPLRWRDSTTYRVTRLTPTGDDLVEGPGHYPGSSGRAAPVVTAATTAGPKPRVLHRRGGSGPPLS